MADELDDVEAPMPWEEGYVEPPVEGAAAEEPELFTAEQVAAARAEALQEAETAAEAKVRQRQSSFDQRQAAMRDAAKARGLLFTEDGKDIGVSDPKAALALLTGASAPVEEKKADTTDYDIYDQASVQRFVQAQVQAGITAALAPLQEQYAQLAGVTAQSLQPNGMNAAKPFLAKLGLGGLEETPEFQDAFNAARAQMPLGSELNANAMKGAAAFAMSQVPEEIQDRVRAAAVQKAAETAAQSQRDLQRVAALGQGTPGSGSRTVPFSAGGQTYLDADTAAIMAQVDEALRGTEGDDPEFTRALMAPDLRDGRPAWQALQDQRAKKAAAGNGRR